MLSDLSVAYYRFENYEFDDKRKYDDLTDEEKELIDSTLLYMGEKMAKAIGGKYYSS